MPSGRVVGLTKSVAESENAAPVLVYTPTVRVIVVGHGEVEIAVAVEVREDRSYAVRHRRAPGSEVKEPPLLRMHVRGVGVAVGHCEVHVAVAVDVTDGEAARGDHRPRRRT